MISHQPAEEFSLSFEDPPHVMVVEARFYTEVADLLAAGATAELDRLGATYERFSVPGALEIPSAIKYAIRGLDFYSARKRFDAYVVLGCVIRGDTTHYDIVCNESARGLTLLSIENTLALGNGILTCENMDQALERADPARMNKGAGAAQAALRMLALKAKFGIYPR